MPIKEKLPDPIKRLGDSSNVKETSHRALNARNVGSALAAGTAAFAIRDLLDQTEKGTSYAKPILGFSYDPKKLHQRYGRYMLGVGASVLGGALAYRALGPKGSIEKKAFVPQLARLGTRLWSNPVTKKVIAHGAVDAGVNAGINAISAPSGEKMQSALSGAKWGAVFGGAMGVGSHMDHIKRTTMPKGQFTPFQRLNQTYKEALPAFSKVSSLLGAVATTGKALYKNKGLFAGSAKSALGWGALDGTVSAATAQPGESRLGAFGKGFGRGAIMGGAFDYGHSVAKGVGGGLTWKQSFANSNSRLLGGAKRIGRTFQQNL